MVNALVGGWVKDYNTQPGVINASGWPGLYTG